MKIGRSEELELALAIASAIVAYILSKKRVPRKARKAATLLGGAWKVVGRLIEAGVLDEEEVPYNNRWKGTGRGGRARV